MAAAPSPASQNRAPSPCATSTCVLAPQSTACIARALCPPRTRATQRAVPHDALRVPRPHFSILDLPDSILLRIMFFLQPPLPNDVGRRYAAYTPAPLPESAFAARAQSPAGVRPSFSLPYEIILAQVCRRFRRVALLLPYAATLDVAAYLPAGSPRRFSSNIDVLDDAMSLFTRCPMRRNSITGLVIHVPGTTPSVVQRILDNCPRVNRISLVFRSSYADTDALMLRRSLDILAARGNNVISEYQDSEVASTLTADNDDNNFNDNYESSIDDGDTFPETDAMAVDQHPENTPLTDFLRQINSEPTHAEPQEAVGGDVFDSSLSQSVPQMLNALASKFTELLTKQYPPNSIAPAIRDSLDLRIYVHSKGMVLLPTKVFQYFIYSCKNVLTKVTMRGLERHVVLNIPASEKLALPQQRVIVQEQPYDFILQSCPKLTALRIETGKANIDYIFASKVAPQLEYLYVEVPYSKSIVLERMERFQQMTEEKRASLSNDLLLDADYYKNLYLPTENLVSLRHVAFPTMCLVSKCLAKETMRQLESIELKTIILRVFLNIFVGNSPCISPTQYGQFWLEDEPRLQTGLTDDNGTLPMFKWSFVKVRCHPALSLANLALILSLSPRLTILETNLCGFGFSARNLLLFLTKYGKTLRKLTLWMNSDDVSADVRRQISRISIVSKCDIAIQMT